jgi:SNF2 family DNA or RNA helicase
VVAKGKLQPVIQDDANRHYRLNLTTANHCILIEPQWNPMVEEQAISRIHRLGQEKPVFICRFVIANTFEQRILERQTRKLVLADLVLGRQKLKEGEDGRKQLAVWLSGY